MGEVIELYGENPLLAECPECQGTSWFIKLDEDAEYESDIDFLLNIRSIICTECKAEFEATRGNLIVAEKEAEECSEQSPD